MLNILVMSYVMWPKLFLPTLWFDHHQLLAYQKILVFHIKISTSEPRKPLMSKRYESYGTISLNHTYISFAVCTAIVLQWTCNDLQLLVLLLLILLLLLLLLFLLVMIMMVILLFFLQIHTWVIDFFPLSFQETQPTKIN